MEFNQGDVFQIQLSLSVHGIGSIGYSGLRWTANGTVFHFVQLLRNIPVNDAMHVVISIGEIESERYSVV